MGTKAVIVARVEINAPDDVTFDEINNAWVEWMSLMALRSWDTTGSTAKFLLDQ